MRGPLFEDFCFLEDEFPLEARPPVSFWECSWWFATQKKYESNWIISLRIRRKMKPPPSLSQKINVWYILPSFAMDFQLNAGKYTIH